MANRIASCIRLNQVPAKYRKEKCSRGTTSIVYEKDKNTVYMLTRDHAKADWLNMSGIGNMVDSFETHGHHISGMDEFCVYVFEIQKLHKLSPENLKIVKAALKEFNEIAQQSRSMKNFTTENRELTLQNIYLNYQRKYKDNEDYLLCDLITTLANFDGNSIYFDMGTRNFLEDENGKIVIIDPIVSSALMDLIHDYKSKKYNAPSFPRM